LLDYAFSEETFTVQRRSEGADRAQIGANST
jgi:hypothetical protein